MWKYLYQSYHQQTLSVSKQSIISDGRNQSQSERYRNSNEIDMTALKLLWRGLLVHFSVSFTVDASHREKPSLGRHMCWIWAMFFQFEVLRCYIVIYNFLKKSNYMKKILHIFVIFFNLTSFWVVKTWKNGFWNKRWLRNIQ